MHASRCLVYFPDGFLAGIWECGLPARVGRDSSSAHSVVYRRGRGRLLVVRDLILLFFLAIVKR